MPRILYPFAQQAGQGVVVPGGLGPMGSFIPTGPRTGNCGQMHAPLDPLTSSDPTQPVSDIVNAQRADARKEGFTQGLIVGAGGAVVATLVLKAVPAVIKIGAVAAAGWYFFGRKDSGRTGNHGKGALYTLEDTWGGGRRVDRDLPLQRLRDAHFSDNDLARVRALKVGAKFKFPSPDENITVTRTR